jgi:hypothetical protein
MISNRKLEMVAVLAIGGFLGSLAASGRLQLSPGANAREPETSVGIKAAVAPESVATARGSQNPTKGQLVAMGNAKAADSPSGDQPTTKPTAGSPSGTTTIDGKYLPNPASKFGGVINLNAKDSKPYWPPRTVPPKGAPNVVLIMTDDKCSQPMRERCFSRKTRGFPRDSLISGRHQIAGDSGRLRRINYSLLQRTQLGRHCFATQYAAVRRSMKNDPDPRTNIGRSPARRSYMPLRARGHGSRNRSDIVERVNRFRNAFISGSGPRIDELLERSRDATAKICVCRRAKCSQLAQPHQIRGHRTFPSFGIFLGRPRSTSRDRRVAVECRLGNLQCRADVVEIH